MMVLDRRRHRARVSVRRPRRRGGLVFPVTLGARPLAVALLPLRLAPLLAGALALPVTGRPVVLVGLPVPLAGDPDEARALCVVLLVARRRRRLASASHPAAARQPAAARRVRLQRPRSPSHRRELPVAALVLPASPRASSCRRARAPSGRESRPTCRPSSPTARGRRRSRRGLGLLLARRRRCLGGFGVHGDRRVRGWSRVPVIANVRLRVRGRPQRRDE